MPSDPALPAAALEAQLLLDTFWGIDLGVVWLDDQARVVHANAFFADWLASDAAELIAPSPGGAGRRPVAAAMGGAALAARTLGRHRSA